MLVAFFSKHVHKSLSFSNGIAALCHSAPRFSLLVSDESFKWVKPEFFFLKKFLPVTPLSDIFQHCQWHPGELYRHIHVSLQSDGLGKTEKARISFLTTDAPFKQRQKDRSRFVWRGGGEAEAKNKVLQGGKEMGRIGSSWFELIFCGLPCSLNAWETVLGNRRPSELEGRDLTLEWHRYTVYIWQSQGWNDFFFKKKSFHFNHFPSDHRSLNAVKFSPEIKHWFTLGRSDERELNMEMYEHQPGNQI